MSNFIKYIPGQLKCENCIYCDDCETIWGCCVANYIDCGCVGHYAICEKNCNSVAATEIMKMINTVKK